MTDPQTIEAEATQALFCAVADYVGKTQIDRVLDLEKYPTYQSFLKNCSGAKNLIDRAYTETQIPGITLKRMETFLKDNPSWYESSVITAKGLIKRLSSIVDKDFKRLERPGFANILYVRGAKADKSRAANAMENIEALWKIANKNNPSVFGDINKWSPADIYFVSSKADERIDNVLSDLNTSAKGGSATVESSFDFNDLNELVSELLDSGDLLPLSLKKVVTGDVMIEKYNFSRDVTEKRLSSIKYEGISDQWKNKYTADKPFTRDIQIYFSEDKKQKIKIRHDPTSKALTAVGTIKTEIEVTGAGGRGGSTSSIDIMAGIVSKIDKKFGSDILKAHEKGLNDYKKAIDDLNKTFNITPSNKSKFLQDKEKYNTYKEMRVDLSGIHLCNSLMGTIYKYFHANEGEKKTEKILSKILQGFVAYTSSQSPQSGKFVKAS